MVRVAVDRINESTRDKHDNEVHIGIHTTKLEPGFEPKRRGERVEGTTGRAGGGDATRTAMKGPQPREKHKTKQHGCPDQGRETKQEGAVVEEVYFFAANFRAFFFMFLLTRLESAFAAAAASGCALSYS